MQSKIQKYRIEQGAKISILLAEYNTLRAEIMQRGTTMVAVISFCATTIAILTGAIVGHLDNCWIVASLFTLIFATMAGTIARVWQDNHMTGLLAARIRTLENEINAIAGHNLLTWENHRGWGQALYKNRKSTARVPPTKA
jgi:hypothetical protein